MARKKKQQPDPHREAFFGALRIVQTHPLLAPMARRTPFRVAALGPGWAVIDGRGNLTVDLARAGTPEQWAWVLAHLLVHLGFGHHQTLPDPHGPSSSREAAAAQAAACAVVDRFLVSVQVGRTPLALPVSWPGGDEQALTRRWRDAAPADDGGQLPAEARGLGVNGDRSDVVPAVGDVPAWLRPPDWSVLFAQGLSAAVAAAVEVAGGARQSLTSGGPGRLAPWEVARRWFLSSYPLLAAAVATLTVVADADRCHSLDIAIAAVDPVAGELYVNPLVQYTDAEWRFVIAHEVLHAALGHHARAGGRDHYLYNVAGDFVINGWLVEMAVGEMPDGLLHDAGYQGWSAEAVYDDLATNARRARKLATARGRAAPDVLGHGIPGADGIGLDAAARRGLSEGLERHLAGGRGLLPAGLVAEIRALSMPPVPWDVALGHWFDEHVPALEPTRSWERPSRRQQAVPDIPLAGRRISSEVLARHTFGVVLDTSGSMSAALIGKGLGAIASYAAAHDVTAARVVFCDAAAYDAGYLPVDDLAGRVKVRGRGGTVLQPGIDLLERAADFPDDAPVLVITDGDIDVVKVRRTHAYLVPAGATLPFRPKGEVFRIS